MVLITHTLDIRLEIIIIEMEDTQKKIDSNSGSSDITDQLSAAPVLDTLVIPSIGSEQNTTPQIIPNTPPTEPPPQPVQASEISMQVQTPTSDVSGIPPIYPPAGEQAIKSSINIAVLPNTYGPNSSSLSSSGLSNATVGGSPMAGNTAGQPPISALDEKNLPENPPVSENASSMGPKKPTSGTTIMVIMLLLLIILPVGVYYISQGQSLNDLRNRAVDGLYGTPTQPPINCPSTSDCRCSNGTFHVCNNVLVQPQFGSSCPNWCAHPYATAAPTTTWTPNARPSGIVCYSDNAQSAAFTNNPPRAGNVNDQLWGCEPSSQGNGWNCTWRDACAPHTQGGVPLVNGSSCSNMRQLSTGESYNGAFVGCSSEGYNCFCSGGGHVGDTDLSGTVRCYADYAGDSCGNQNGPGSPNTPGSTRPPGDTDTPIITQPPVITDTNTPTSTPVVTNTPTNTPVITSTNTPTSTPVNTNTPTYTPTATPTSTVGCNESCTVNTDCNSGTVCADGTCRNPQCSESTTCQCATITNTSTPTPSPVAFVGCNSACSVNTDCSSGLVCIDSVCRNPSCTDKTSCQCDIAQVTPKTPVAGTGPSVLGASVIAGGFFLVLLGLAL